MAGDGLKRGTSWTKRRRSRFNRWNMPSVDGLSWLKSVDPQSLATSHHYVHCCGKRRHAESATVRSIRILQNLSRHRTVCKDKTVEPPGTAAINTFPKLLILPQRHFPTCFDWRGQRQSGQIGHEDNRSTATFLSNTSAVQRVDERMPDYKLGYTISDSTSDLSRLMHMGGNRVKMLLFLKVAREALI